MTNEECCKAYKQALLDRGFTDYLADFLVSQLNDILIRIDALNKSVSEISFELIINGI